MLAPELAVSVVPHTTGWLVNGKAGPRPQLVVDQQVQVRAVRNWQGSINSSGSSWSWYDYAALATPNYDTWQGVVPPQQGGDGYVQTTWDTRVSVLGWGTLASLVPSGATISQVTLRARSAELAARASAPAVARDGRRARKKSTVQPALVAGFAPSAIPNRRAARGSVRRRRVSDAADVTAMSA